jgi:hypothetical protein
MLGVLLARRKLVGETGEEVEEIRLAGHMFFLAL